MGGTPLYKGPAGRRSSARSRTLPSARTPESLLLEEIRVVCLTISKKAQKILETTVSYAYATIERTHYMKNARISDESCPTRASLVRRLKDWGDHTGWQEFYDTYWRLIHGTATRAGLGDAEAQDVVQETILSIAKAMPEFEYDPAKGSFKSWLRNTTHWRIKDHLRRKARHSLVDGAGEGGPSTPLLQRLPDPATLDKDAVWNADWERNLLEAAIEKVKKKVKPKQYQLFDCFVLRGWPMSEITQKLRVSMGQVYFAKVKVSSMVQKEFRELERKWQ
jgi:RNA polymerase sigma factor (sigma-70 family)